VRVHVPSSARSSTQRIDGDVLHTANAARATFDRALYSYCPPLRSCSCCSCTVPTVSASFEPKEGGWLGNYKHFFTTDNLWPTIWTTLKLALPATLINVGFALPIAYKMRVKSRYQRWVTTILVIPITLGTVLIAEGMLTYFGPKGWLSQFLQFFHLYEGPIRLTHNYWGVLISLVISGFPFAFLLILSTITGIDPVLARRLDAGCGPKGATGTFICRCSLDWRCFALRSCRRTVFRRPCAGFPGPRRDDSIAAYEAAFSSTAIRSPRRSHDHGLPGGHRRRCSPPRVLSWPGLGGKGELVRSRLRGR
jgi:hypothetical protein